MAGVGRPDGDDAPGRVAYQGAPGAFSHEACAALRPWDEAVGFDTFAEALEALRSGDCDCALIPVENSSYGIVEPAASLVRDGGFTVVAEVWRPIRLALMAAEDARLSDIRTVESHPVALGQCRAAIEALKLQPVEHFDTAGAARDVAAAGDPTRAALASAAAAEVYSLSILRNDLQDSPDNRTRFLLVSAPEG
jgi:prephenate dehydratase